VADSIQFGINNEVISTDGQALNKELQKTHVTDISASRGIKVNLGGAYRVNIGGDGPVERLSGGMNPDTVILDPFAGRSATVAGLETSKAAAEKLATMRPDLANSTVEPRPGATMAAQPSEAEIEAQRTLARVAAEKEAVAHRILNSHPVEEIEAVHTKVAQNLPLGLVTSILDGVRTGRVPSEAQIKRAADALGTDVNGAWDALSTLNLGIQQQVAMYARLNGVDADRFAQFVSKQDGVRLVSAMARHVHGRDINSAYGEMLAQFKARGGR
jgi:hypothetical protein